MAKQISSLPVPVYIHKWLKSSHGYRSQIEAVNYIPTAVATNRVAVYRFFANSEGLPTIRVCMYYPSRLKLYTFGQQLEAWFNAEMILHIQSALKLDIPARAALKQFLRRNRIGEDELALDTAYKRWQRAGKNSLPGVRVL